MLEHIVELDTGSVVAIKGYRRRCGKTALALAIAAQNTDKTVCIVSPGFDIQTSDFGRYCLSEMGVEVGNFQVATTFEEAEADIIICDGGMPPSTTHVFYITPETLTDPDVGYIDKRYADFCRHALHHIESRFDAVVSFLPESEVDVLSPRQHDLTQTDWIVLRALEQQFLRGTPVGNTRRFIREVKNKVVSDVHKF